MFILGIVVVCFGPKAVKGLGNPRIPDRARRLSMRPQPLGTLSLDSLSEWMCEEDLTGRAALEILGAVSGEKGEGKSNIGGSWRLYMMAWLRTKVR